MPWKTPGSTGTSTNFTFIDTGTMCLNTSCRPGPLVCENPATVLDEITPIAVYMTAEINTNAHSAAVTQMAQMNKFSAVQCILDFQKLPIWKQLLGWGLRPQDCQDLAMSNATAALLAWALKVQQNGDWDHKPRISALFHPRSSGRQYWHRYQQYEYYYDVWSNLHYGYVGTASGFSESALLDGAGMEQIVSTLARFKRPLKSPDISGLRAWDDAPDRAAIMEGIKLYRRNSTRVSASDLVQFVLSSPAILKRPYTP